MMGSFITRAIIMVVGYVYPAYECFKCVEKNRPDVEQLRFWCQYWMIIAILTVLERLGDTFISWLPMYSEAKLAFIIYLWYPKTKGTTYVYSTFLKPFVANHEVEIDRNLNEFKTRAGDLAFRYWQKGSVYLQSRFMELLQYVSSQSPSSRPQQGSNVSQFQPPPPPSGYRQPPSVYQSQSPPPPPPPTPGYEPSAPELPASYQSGVAPPPGAVYQPQPPPPPGYSLHQPPASLGVSQQPYYMNEDEAEYEVMGVVEPQPVSQPVVNVPNQSAYMTRSRQRTRRQK